MVPSSDSIRDNGPRLRNGPTDLVPTLGRVNEIKSQPQIAPSLRVVRA